VDQGVVLKDHRQPRVGAEQGFSNIGPSPRQAPKSDADRCLARHPDLEVRGPIAGVHDLEPLEQSVPELLGHPFSADQRTEPIFVPREALALALIEEVLHEGRVAADEVPKAGSKELERREDLADVGTD